LPQFIMTVTSSSLVRRGVVPPPKDRRDQMIRTASPWWRQKQIQWGRAPAGPGAGPRSRRWFARSLPSTGLERRSMRTKPGWRVGARGGAGGHGRPCCKEEGAASRKLNTATCGGKGMGSARTHGLSTVLMISPSPHRQDDHHQTADETPGRPRQGGLGSRVG